MRPHALLIALVARVSAQDEQSGPIYPLGAKVAWRLGSAQYRRVRDQTANWRKRDITECFSGQTGYQEQTVFCDSECIRQVGRRGNHSACAGPWYCATTSLVQQYNDDLQSQDFGGVRRSMAVKGCASLEQCFPTEAQAAADNIAYPRYSPLKNLHSRRSYDHAIKYGGVSSRTSCCANKKNYHYVKDMPCNGAALRGAALASAVVAAALFLL
mmetsp:Transcript_32435/g.100369  ORF Transcript_32435/g.100369 Transcript_32435/m.100369 type:complete len:213 (-) Transcript_32435:28-666(-)